LSRRLILFLVLAAAAAGSGWLMKRISSTEPTAAVSDQLDPDYYMEDFTTISMDENGQPASRLYAVYMEHNPVDDTLELYEPNLEVYRGESDPLRITADKGWVTNNNEVILLRGKVRMWIENASGQVTLNVDTTEVLLLEEYAETDQNATIVAKRTTVKGRGIRAHFDDNRLEILDHEQTTIAPPDRI
jgi:lipopolysaccharide export system protein LptC